jgi:hypothetical protein
MMGESRCGCRCPRGRSVPAKTLLFGIAGQGVVALLHEDTLASGCSGIGESWTKSVFRKKSVF